VSIQVLSGHSVISVFASALLPHASHTTHDARSLPPQCLSSTLSREKKKHHGDDIVGDLRALENGPFPFSLPSSRTRATHVDRADGKSMHSAHPPRRTYSLTTKNGFSSVIPLSAPSLNLKPGPRPVSPRRPRGTLGGSALAPRPLAHRWEILERDRRSSRGTVCSLGSRWKLHPLSGACDGSARTVGVVGARSLRMSHSYPRRDVVTSDVCSGSGTAIYSIHPRGRARPVAARRGATPRDARDA